jgi:trimethylamine--corrinoid protein Co-methyltransferase
MAQRANTLWKRQLADTSSRHSTPAVDEALLEYINRRKAAAPDSNF